MCKRTSDDIKQHNQEFPTGGLPISSKHKVSPKEVLNSRNSRLCKSAEQTGAGINEIFTRCKFFTPVKGE